MNKDWAAPFQRVHADKFKRKDKMNIEEIKVPEEIEYISQWEGFELPKGHSIIDKTICGCGFTEFCLINQKKAIIITVPRNSLIDNKGEQHKDDPSIYCFKNEKPEKPEGYDSANSTSDKLNLNKISPEERQSYLMKLKLDLYNWIKQTINLELIPKIMVTYDSLHHILDVTKDFDIDFHVVVDEFQSIFLDASFKAEVELSLVEDLKNYKDVTYISATPMLEKYLDQLDYFKELQVFKFIWPECRIENIRIERRIVPSISSGLKELIYDYKTEVFPTKVLQSGEVVKSKELVMFVNSIKTIIDIIRGNGLVKSEINILCANTPANMLKLKKVGLEVGHIPLKGEPHKMFTFCTRTTYLGADFYSTSAYSVVCSDCGIKSLALDISLDLPQIIGRQRLKENLFRNEVLFLYKAVTIKESSLELSEREYAELINEQDDNTTILLDSYKRMTERERQKWLTIIKDKDRSKLYESDFLSISKRTGEPVYNYLVKIAKQRAYDVTRKDYQDTVTIKRGMEEISSVNVNIVDKRVFNEYNEEAEELIKVFESTNSFEERMRAFCKSMNECPTLVCHSYLNVIIPLKYFNYYNLLGSGLIGTLMYVEKNIKNAYEKKLNEGNTNLAESGLFTVGERYTKANIKEMIKQFYNENNIVKTAKASDLDAYYDLKPCLIKNPDTGKMDHGFIIVRRKDI